MTSRIALAICLYDNKWGIDLKMIWKWTMAIWRNSYENQNIFQLLFLTSNQNYLKIFVQSSDSWKLKRQKSPFHFYRLWCNLNLWCLFCFCVNYVSIFKLCAFRYQLSFKQLKALPFDFVLVAKKASELINAENL